MQFDRTKLADLVLHICGTTSPETLGAVKLHKILFFSDMVHYLDSGSPLTGETYRKNDFGPTAAHLWDVMEALKKSGKLRYRQVDFFGFPKWEFEALDEVDLEERFSKRQIELVETVKRWICDGHSAASISDLSHNRAWELTDQGETIPYHTAYQMIPVEITDADLKWAEAEAKAVADFRPPA